MLPVYGNSQAAGAGLGHFRPHVASTAYTHGRSFFRRKWTKRAVQLIVVSVCVIYPLWHLFQSRASSTDGASSSSGSSSSQAGGRRLRAGLREDLLPAAALKNLVLVAGHAVYTGVDFTEAKLESSWFLEPYQQVPGGLHLTSAGWPLRAVVALALFHTQGSPSDALLRAPRLPACLAHAPQAKRSPS